jgi:hypothetical protein
MMVMAVTGSASRIARNTFTDSALRRSSILRSNSSYLNGIVPLRSPSLKLWQSCFVVNLTIRCWCGIDRTGFFHDSA